MRQCADIRASLAATKLAGQARVWHMSVERAVGALDKAYDLVLMDPPYRDPFPAHVLERLEHEGLLQPHAIVVVGHTSRVPSPSRCGGLARWSERRYGDSSLAFYSLQPVGEPVESSA